MAAARAAGQLLRAHWHRVKTIHASTQHDIKLEMDVRCQTLLEKRLLAAFPETAVLGEEGTVGRQEETPLRWVVDPIDGTVNYTYGIPHACVSIALQERVRSAPRRAQAPSSPTAGAYHTVLGVVFDPFTNELWTAVRGQAARLNGRPIRVSDRRLDESMVSIGFSKTQDVLRMMVPQFIGLVPRVRKIRIMGSAALALTYVACGRFDAFIEPLVSLWDIAAGALVLECAGGDFWHCPLPDRPCGFRVVATNGRLRRQLEQTGLFRDMNQIRA